MEAFVRLESFLRPNRFGSGVLWVENRELDQCCSHPLIGTIAEMTGEV